MIEIVYISLFAMIGAFLYNAYLIFFSKRSENIPQAINKWKLSLFLFIIALIIYFLYFGTTFNTIQYNQTITDGTDTYTITNNEYLDALSFSPMMTGMLLMNFIFLVIAVMQEFKVFAQRGRMKKKKRGF